MSDEKLTEEEEKEVLEAWYDIAKERVKVYDNVEEFLKELKKGGNYKILTSWCSVEHEGDRYKIYEHVSIDEKTFTRFVKEEDTFPKAIGWAIENILKNQEVISAVKEIKLNLDYLQFVICSKIDAKFHCNCLNKYTNYCKTVKEIAEEIVKILNKGGIKVV